MKLSNLHVHTEFCDGAGTPEDYCRAACEAGLVSIGFSAHAPLVPSAGVSTDWHLPRERFSAYCAAVLACRAKYAACAPPLRVYLGLEADYIAGGADAPFCQSPASAVAALGLPAAAAVHGGAAVHGAVAVEPPPVHGAAAHEGAALDYLIGSVHCVIPPGENARRFFGRYGKMLSVDGSAEDWALLVDECFDGDVWRLVDAYWGQQREMIEEGGFDILGHADLLKKNNRGANCNNRGANCNNRGTNGTAGGRGSPPRRFFFDETDGRYLRCLTRAADSLAGRDIVVEINTGGINRGYTAETYPSLAFLRLLWERGVPVTINGDSHKPAHIAGGYAKAVETARAAGYTDIMLFAGRQNGKALWTPEPLF